MAKLPSSFLSSFRLHETLVNGGTDGKLGFQGIKDKEWIIALMIVEFDTMIGPDMKLMRPSVEFSEEEFRKICFSSMPESTEIHDSNNEVNEGSKGQFHCFRMLIDAASKTEPKAAAPPPKTLAYGNCLFTRAKDSREHRGYKQQSFVILSKIYVPDLFKQCLDELCHQMTLSNAFDSKLALMDSALSNINTWPPPFQSIEYGFLGRVFVYDNVQGPSRPVPIIEDWLPYMSWSMVNMAVERLLLSKKVVIYAPQPSECSMGVQNLSHLVDLYPVDPSKVFEYSTIYHIPPDWILMGTTNPTILADLDADTLVIAIVTTQSSEMQLSKLWRRISACNKGIARKRMIAIPPKPYPGISTKHFFDSMVAKLIVDILPKFFTPCGGASGGGLRFDYELFFATAFSFQKSQKHRHSAALTSPLPTGLFMNESGPDSSLLQRIGSRALLRNWTTAAKYENMDSATKSMRKFYMELFQSTGFKSWLDKHNVMI